MNFSEQFPILGTCTYLNTANSGILSQPLLEWRRAHDLEFLAGGSIFRVNQSNLLSELKANLARIFHAKPENTFLIPNFSFGFNTFLDGLSGTHRFLLLEEEYPSVNYPIQGRGFTCDYAVIDEHLEDNILEKIKYFQPTVLAISIVQYISGIKIDFEFLKKIKSLYPELLIVADGTQFCGTTKFDFEDSALDVLLSSGYKWMLGGYGNGFLFMKDKVAKELYAEHHKNPMPLEPFLKDKGALNLCFEPGHLDTLSFGTLNQSLFFLEKLGIDFIEKQINTVSEQAKVAFASRGLLDQAVVLRKEHSSIFNLAIKEEVYAKLQEANINCSPRGKGMRISFHFYNNIAELEKLLEVIDSCD